MADWPEIRKYLTAEYSVETETGGYISFRRPVGGDRSVNLVVVDHGVHYERSWVGIGAVVGRRDPGSGGPTEVELLNINADLPCGGLALTEDNTIMLEYAIRTNDLELEQLGDRIAFLTEIAAELGQWYNQAGRGSRSRQGE